jgi:hypothetical protein
MPLKFWDETFFVATFLINHTSSKILKFSTPLERLFNTKPDYTSLRIYGYAQHLTRACHATIPKTATLPRMYPTVMLSQA